MLNGICGDIDNAEVRVVFEAGYVGDGIVGDVELFEVLESGKPGYGGEAVGR